VPGPVVELGSGAGFFRQVAPDAITSDIQVLPTADLALDATRLPFRTASLRAVTMVDVFHHLPDAGAFLSEVRRCLKPRGCVVMIEPWLTPWSGWIYRWLHHEPCQAKARYWRLSPGGPLSRANSALPWIVFSRDLPRTTRWWPELELRPLRPHTPFRYLLSGGMSYPALVPAVLFDTATRLERLLQPWQGWLSMFATIVLRRRGG